MKIFNRPRADFMLNEPLPFGSAAGGAGKSLRYAQHLIAVSSVFGALMMVVFNPYDRPFTSMLLAGVVVFVGMIPLYRWLGNSRRNAVPVLEMHSFFYSLTFGLAGFLEPSQLFSLDWVSEGYRQAALFMTLFGLLSLYAGYYVLGRGLESKAPKWRWNLEARASGFNLLAVQIYPPVLVLNALLINLQVGEVLQITRALQTFLFLWLAHAFFTGRLMGVARLLFLFAYLPYQLLVASGLAEAALAGTLAISLWLGIIYVHARRRVPLIFVCFAIGMFVLLQPVKSEFRVRTWGQEDIGRIEKLKMFLQLGLDYYFSDSADKGVINEGLANSYDRLNNLQTMGGIIADTPDVQPYQYGKTYLPILTKWIPRFIWPDKPFENLGNIWAHEYGYIADDDFVTAYNLPWLCEMYMNFGVFGVVFINLLIGILFRVLSVALWKTSRGSGEFAFGLFLGAQLMIVEVNLSLLIGGMIIGTIILLVFSRCCSALFGKHFYDSSIEMR
jgi:hypothetical protein